MYFSYAKIPRKKNLQSVIAFSNVFENFFIHKTMLSAILQKSASFRSRRAPKPRISTVFRKAQMNASKASRKSTENRMTKRMGFYKKRSEVQGRACPTEDDGPTRKPLVHEKIFHHLCPKNWSFVMTHLRCNFSST